ncbi:hypothetical protein LYNGBM3L_61290 [Moorena producens 3L]|uniref:Uncharacterized protein n=1 Tax=Moorena producens 3L TaxID=489825 RepID=F4Y0F5_9CYAN|nr:hypothetical protein LYNGBM3L_61290 [Moorena producens 3L]
MVYGHPQKMALLILGMGRGIIPRISNATLAAISYQQADR